MDSRALDRTRGVEPANPYEDGDAFVSWLRTPSDVGPPRVSRYLESVWAERADLRAAFRTLAEPDEFLHWALQHGVADGGVPVEMLPDTDALARPPHDLDGIRATAASAPERPTGINVAGYFASENGVGEGARLLVSVLREANIPHSLVGYTETVSRQKDPFGHQVSDSADNSVNVVCVNADEFVRFARGAGRALFDGRPTVGLWFWEVEKFPGEMTEAARYVDEIWTGSQHASAALRTALRDASEQRGDPALDVPVFTFPLPIVPPQAPTHDRAALGLPEDAFIFLFAFSFPSVVARKNPFGLIDAFTRAFEPGEGPILLIKSSHGEHNLPELERLRAAAAGRSDIIVRDGVVDRADRRASCTHATRTSRCTAPKVSA